MRIIQHNLIIKLFLACLLALINFQAHADASPDIWPYLKQQVFKDRVINEDQNFLKIDYNEIFERLMMFITGMKNIRDVIPFPRTPQNAEF